LSYQVLQGIAMWPDSPFRQYVTVSIRSHRKTAATGLSQIHQTLSRLDCSPDKWHQLRLASSCSPHYRCLGWLWSLEVCPNQALSDHLALSIADLISRFSSLWLLSRFLWLGLVLMMPQNGKPL